MTARCGAWFRHGAFYPAEVRPLEASVVEPVSGSDIEHLCSQSGWCLRCHSMNPDIWCFEMEEMAKGRWKFLSWLRVVSGRGVIEDCADLLPALCS